jgi:hypothetical protein
VGIGARSAVDAHLHRSGQLLEAVDTSLASARMACGIARSVPEVFRQYATKPPSPTNLVNMALEALHQVGCYDSDGWLTPITADLCYGEPVTPADCNAVLGELAYGVTLATETSDLYEISQPEMPPAYRLAFALMGSADGNGEPDPFGYQEEQPALPLAIAAGLSLSGLIFPQEEAVPWPSSSPYWRALAFFDASSGNELVDLRTGTADVGWDQLDTLREEIVDAHRYLNAAVDFMRAVDDDDPVSALVAWAGHMRRDLRRALAQARSREGTNARS